MITKIEKLSYDGLCRKCASHLKSGDEAWWDPDGTKGSKLICNACHTDEKEDPKMTFDLFKAIGVEFDHTIFDGEKLVGTFNKTDLITIATELGGLYRVSSRSKADLAGQIAQVALNKHDTVSKVTDVEWPAPEDTKKTRDYDTPEHKVLHDWYAKARNRYELPRSINGLRKAARSADKILALSGKKVGKLKPRGEKAAELVFKSSQIDDIQSGLEDHISTVLESELAATRAQQQTLVDKSQRDMLNAKNRVLREVREHLSDLKVPQKVTLKPFKMPEVELGYQHHRFTDLLALLNAGITVMMVGPAGTGKSTAPAVYAEAIGRRFLPMSLGPHTMQSQIVGYTDGGTGAYVRTPFRDFFENGGVILLDELDRCNERVAVTLNAALANRICSFPDKVIKQHDDCLIVAAGNTAGHGADRQYVSARQQDAALMDRFAMLEWGYDEGFELSLAKAIYDDCDNWVQKVWLVRRAAEKHRMRYVVSPRASIQGAQGLAAGLDVGLLESTILYRGWTADDRKKIEAEVGEPEVSNA